MKNITIYLLALVALFFFSCTDLEENLVGEITEDINLPGIDTGTSSTSSGLGAMYSSLRDAGSANHGGYYSIQEITSDEMVICAKGGDWFDGGILVELHQHTYTATHDFVKNGWNQIYGAINTCNDVAGGDFDASQKAQARALRAYYYWRLMDLYGSVKIVTETDADPPQASRQQVFDFVEGELLSVLGLSSVSAGMDLSGSALGTDAGTYSLNQYGALGILSKVYLNAEVYTGSPRWGEAAMAAGYVIDNSPYQLCGAGCSVANLGKRAGVASDPDVLEGYAAVFAPNNTGNPEHIFAINYDEITASGMNFGQMNLHYSSQFTWNFDAQPWNGYATLEEFYNSYEDGDARKANNFIAGEQLDFGGSAVLDYASDDGNLVLNYTPSINELVPNSQREAGARPSKFSFKQLGRPEMDNDFPVVRLGELYLNRAEGMARMSGNWDAGAEFVNALRARAGVADMSGMTAESFLAERGREMFQETSRRTDLIRFGKFNDAWWQKSVDASDHVNIFPIPQEQIQAAGGSLTQNPGY